MWHPDTPHADYTQSQCSDKFKTTDITQRLALSIKPCTFSFEYTVQWSSCHPAREVGMPYLQAQHHRTRNAAVSFRCRRLRVLLGLLRLGWRTGALCLHITARLTYRHQRCLQVEFPDLEFLSQNAAMLQFIMEGTTALHSLIPCTSTADTTKCCANSRLPILGNQAMGRMAWYYRAGTFLSRMEGSNY